MQKQVDLFLEHMVNKKDSSENTLAAYRNDLGQFMQFAENQKSQFSKWSDLTEKDLKAYLTYLTKKKAYATATAARKFAVLKSFLQFLHSSGKLPIDPSKDLSAPKVKKSPPRTIDHDEVNRLLAEPAKSTTPKALRDKAIMELLYSTGMRVTELINLEVSDLKPAKRIILCGVNERKQRSVDLSKEVLEHLKQYLDQGRPTLGIHPEEKALFLNHRGRRLTRQGLWLIIKGYVKAVGIEGVVTPHTLRHSFASHLVSSGTELKVLQEKLGHASVSTTQVYRQSSKNEPSLVIDGQSVTPNDI